MDYGCDSDAEMSCVTFDDDDANGHHVAMNETFLRFSPRARRANYQLASSMAMKLDCMQPTRSTFQPSIGLVVRSHTIANNFEHEYCSMWWLAWSW